MGTGGADIQGRPFEAPGDLRLMQALQQELWPLEGPRVHAHVGDLAWWATMHTGREREWKRHLWIEDGRCVAWAWLQRPASLDYQVHSAHRGGELHHEILDWFEAEAEGDGPLSTYLMDGDEPSLGVLAERGYREPENAMSYAYHVSDLELGGLPAIPDGYSFRTVTGAADLHERVEVHRAVWAPSRVTEESYRNVMQAWPYRRDLDCVVEAPDGTFASYALCWYDDANGVGELEPVGTHPDHRRMGLGAAACLFALHRLSEEGGRQGIVYAGGRDEDAPARALYESIGFRRHTREVEVQRRR
jgi:ribosomal protein S18 acetylase RimI-like enzyme